MKPQVVWFKRDFRVVDHRPLAAAAQRGPVIALYAFEPDYWRLPDSSGRHWLFVRDCLTDLDIALRGLGAELTVRRGPIIEVLRQLAGEVGPFDLWSHEETGNAWTFARDRAVASWCRTQGIRWTELPQFGVIRRLSHRGGWAKRWDAMMAEPITQAPQLPTPSAALSSDALPEKAHRFQRGGRVAGLDTLRSFLDWRGRNYRAGMASPLTGFDDCSRLSPHITWGSISMREVYQAALGPTELSKSVIQSFIGRLHWHCHFMQKLEDEPSIELEPFHPAYRGLRDGSADDALLTAWAKGHTGYPFVDACMRALNETGYLNFRARAMLVSFASYQLWQPWQNSGTHLARQFTDYEPGIHWSQVQMQSGTTGINQIRIYNPVKQGLDNDPTGAFTRRWLPELAGVDDAHLHEPWKSPLAGQLLGKAYPEPIVDLKAATTRARDLIWSVRKEAGFGDTANAVQRKHGSRKAGVRRPDKQRAPSKQGELQL